MSPHVRVARGRDGQLVAAKAAWPRGAEHRLVREAAVLVTARHPGVVAVRGVVAHDGHLELHTGWVGPRSLADVGHLAPDEAARVIGAVAATLADLHALGITHGSLDASHVLLDRAGRPVLCSFGRAQVGTRADARQADVAAVGDLLEQMIGPPDEPDLVPTRRFGRRRAGQLHRHLLTIANHARAHDPDVRPTADALAATLADLSPDPAHPRAAEVEPRSRLDREGIESSEPRPLGDDLERLRATATVAPPRRRWPFGLVALALLVSVTGVGVLVAQVGGTAQPASISHADLPLVDPGHHEVAPDPATDPEPAPVVELAGSAYSVGTSGDRVAIGDWRCEGRQSVLVLRPATGELFLFDEPTTSQAEVHAGAFARQPAATELVGAVPGEACPRPAAIDASGRVRPIALPPRPTS